ncbi:MAG: hypothetical protein AMXMBFR7_03870 [Planctomycetota bacterium]
MKYRSNIPAWALLSALLGGIALTEDAAPVTPVPFADTDMAIDGKLDEAVWKAAAPIRCDHLNTTGVLDTAAHMTVRVAWDRQYLYLGYETFDKQLVAAGSGKREGPAERPRDGASIWGGKPNPDVVEFFLTLGDRRCFWELHHNALNQFNDVYCVLADDDWVVTKAQRAQFGILFFEDEWLRDQGAHTVRMAIQLKPKADGQPSTVNAPGDEDSGYTGECRIPWGSIDAPKDKFKKPPKGQDGEASWHLEGHKLQLLAVVQDSDQKERYFHNAPRSLHPWMHKGIAHWPQFELQSPGPKEGALLPVAPDVLEAAELKASMGELFAKAERGESVAQEIQELARFGMAALEGALPYADQEKATRGETLIKLAAALGLARQSHAELLRMYDPVAHRWFYEPEGRNAQARLGALLDIPTWPADTPRAMALAAPLPTLEWLHKQAQAPEPRTKPLRAMLETWGGLVEYKHERQYRVELQKAAVELAASAGVVRDSELLAALLRFVGDVRAQGALEFAVLQAAHADGYVRAMALNALGRLGGERALAALSERAGIEADPAAQDELALALQGWPEASEAGMAALKLYERAASAQVKRTMLYVAARTSWAQRVTLIEKALGNSGENLAGPALQALAARPVPELRAKVLALLRDYPDESPPPTLIDALAEYRAAEAAPVLVRALKAEENVALRIKLVLALEKVGGPDCAKALAELLEAVDQPLLAEYMIGISGRMPLKEATPTLLELARDRTAPLKVRVQCLWALGRIPDPRVLPVLVELERDFAASFGDLRQTELSSSHYEQRHQAWLYLKLALAQHGHEPTLAELESIYDTGTPFVKLALLMGLASIKRDHAIVAKGLQSSEFAVVYAALHAALAGAPQVHAEAIRTFRDAPFVKALVESGIDIRDFAPLLDRAVANAGRPEERR